MMWSSTLGCVPMVRTDAVEESRCWGPDEVMPGLFSTDEERDTCNQSHLRHLSRVNTRVSIIIANLYKLDDYYTHCAHDGFNNPS